MGSIDRRAFVAAGMSTAVPVLRTGTRDFAEDFELFWNRTWTYTLEVADAMPPEEYGFRPVPEIRSFGEQLAHIAQGHFNWAGTIDGAPVPDPPDFTTLSAVDAVAIRSVLDRSFDVLLRAVLARSDAELDRRVQWGRRLGVQKSHSLRGVALTAWHHTAHHRGQCIIYLRLKSIVPPGYVD